MARPDPVIPDPVVVELSESISRTVLDFCAKHDLKHHQVADLTAAVFSNYAVVLSALDRRAMSFILKNIFRHFGQIPRIRERNLRELMSIVHANAQLEDSSFKLSPELNDPTLDINPTSEDSPDE